MRHSGHLDSGIISVWGSGSEIVNPSIAKNVNVITESITNFIVVFIRMLLVNLYLHKLCMS